MTITQLEYFMAVAEKMSFSAAAKKLYITQPALSRSISALEKELGTPLFVRSSQTISLTAAGRVLASELPPLGLRLTELISAVCCDEDAFSSVSC